MGVQSTLLDPTTGKPYTTGAATEGKTGTAHFGQTKTALSGANDGQIDWTKTGWNIGANGETHGSEYFTPPTGSYGFQVGENAGWLDATTGQINYGTKQGLTGVPTDLASINSTVNYGITPTGQYQYDVGSDYGLGSTALGIIPMQHDATGQVSQYVTATAGGGYGSFTTLAEAQAARDEYLTWRPTTKAGQAELAGTTTIPAANAPATDSKPGELYNPGVGENYYDSTKGFYTQPTEASKQWDATKGQPTAADQNWNGLSGQFNAPSDQESLWGNYRDTFADPNALAGIYDREQQRTQVALDRRASSAGVGDSSAAARATSNIGQDFADRRLKATEGWATTGMGLAGASDAGRTGRANTLAGLAGNKDTADINRIGAANTVDAGNLAQVSGGQVSANSAEQLAINRANGATSGALSIGNDIGTLTAAGYSQANATTLSGQMDALALQVANGTLDYNSALQQAKEQAAVLGVVSDSVLTAMLYSKMTAGKK
jgi:hypothetical protein